MDLPETRELSYFVAVAEELHFGKAAERLGMTQPPLSRAIRQLERRVGTPLFQRTSRHVALTPAGAELLAEGRIALDALGAAVQRARRAAEPERRLTLVMKPGGDAGLLVDILDAYRSAPRAIPVDVVFSFGARGRMLREGRADVALLHRPANDLTGLATEDLLRERQIVILPRDHRLARRASVMLGDLKGETLPRWPEAINPGTGPEVFDTGQLMQLIALRRLVAVVPESATALLRPDLVGVPVRDAPATTLVLAWPEQATLPALADFVRIARDIAGRHSDHAVPRR
jgi:DNA-binding transcriptional LysR family regulator